MTKQDKKETSNEENKKDEPIKNNDIDKLKAEIMKEVSMNKKSKREINWNSLAVTSVLIILAVISIGQTVQSATILKKINSGNLAPSANSTSPLPSSLENLPDMVGGC